MLSCIQTQKDADGKQIPDISDTDSGPVSVAETDPAAAPESLDGGGAAGPEAAIPEIVNVPPAPAEHLSVDIRV